MPRGGHDIPVSGTHLKGTQWLRRVDPTVGHLKGTPWSRRVWTPQIFHPSMSEERIMETEYFPFIRLIWWMVDHPCYLFIRRDGLSSQLGFAP